MKTKRCLLQTLLLYVLASTPSFWCGNVAAQAFTNLHSFTATLNPNATNSDGYYPVAELLLSGHTLYGTASFGGSWGSGTVFKLNTDGIAFTNLHSFTALSTGSPYTNSDGYGPLSGLIIASNTLYGTTSGGGVFGYGTVFKLNTDGTGFTNLYSFTGSGDGAYPQAKLILYGNTLLSRSKRQ